MRNRSVVELLALGFAFLIGLVIVGLGAGIIVAEIVDPEADTGRAVNALGSLVTGILGALLGLIARGSDDLSRHPDDR